MAADYDTDGKRFSLVRSIGIECISDDELKELLKNKERPVVYDGFEPSGRMHIAQALLRCVNTNKLLDAGCHMKLWIADWFAKMNNKCNGDLDKIRILGQYFIEIWRASKMRVDEVEFIWASEEINKRSAEYWEMVIDIAQKNNIKRIKRCCQIMGRTEDSDSKLSASQIMYPCMQCADIFFLGVDICQLGVDQRKVNMLAREYANASKLKPPIILSHGMIMSLKGVEHKMSKSDPNTAIFVEDDAETVRKKINKAFCPPEVYDEAGDMINPVFTYIDRIIMPYTGEPFIVKDKPYTDIKELANDYKQSIVTAAEVKSALIEAINNALQPIRDHFKSGANAELLRQVHSIEITR